MTSPGPGGKLTAEQNAIAINKKIVELKKKILLAEGQKKAYREDWEEEKRINTELITELKKNIKELTSKLIFLKNQQNGKTISKPQIFEGIKKATLPPGAATIEDAVNIFDLRVIEAKKQIDLLHDRYVKRQKFFKNLVDEYQTLLASKNQNTNLGNTSAVVNLPPETVEEDSNRKLICHLENEIHRTSVQWMEAEHIRKKYRGIKASLMNDSENFESSLLELEQAIIEQQAEIEKLEHINQEALEMRDNTKLVLQKQEQAATNSTKAREKQALDFRRQVDERKLELERLERKIFATGKTLVHQESVGSGSGEPQTAKTDQDDDQSAHAKETTNVMDFAFRKLMESTGATATNEVLGRFLSQREATTRLGYLRSATEATKKSLEIERETLSSQLETFRFADIKENEINQEEVERFKTEIEEQKQKEITYEVASEHTRIVIGSIKESLLELLLKLREIEEMTEKNIKLNCPYDFADLMSGNISSDQLLNILQENLRIGLIASGLYGKDTDSGIFDNELATSEIDITEEDLHVAIPLQSPTTAVEEKERPSALPPCYVNLLAGRTTGQISSISPGQVAQITPSDEEGDVPSRHYLKRQAQLIVDSKSRRKGFRAPVPARRK